MARWRRIRALAAAGALPVLLARAAAGADAAPTAPRAYLIYLIGSPEPLVVPRYVEEADQIRFEKYGGWVGIPRYEILRIVPDEPSPPAALPPPLSAKEPGTPLYVATRGGASLRATAVDAQGVAARISTREGSITLPRADVVGILRIPPPPAVPEAWVALVGAHGFRDPGPREATAAPPPPASRSEVPPDTAVPAHSSRPHLLHLAGGSVLEIDGFWIEDGQLRFRRLGGVVGFALSEVARLVPQDPAPVDGRVPAQFLRRLGPERLEARVGRAVRQIRLIGVEPVPGATSPEDPWVRLARGLVVQLEFDRQRYGPGGDWLAYVHLPNGRMLNAELIRVGLARPRPEPRNLRYVDLLQEVWRAAGSAPRMPPSRP
jgi:hypothetical protein